MRKYLLLVVAFLGFSVSVFSQNTERKAFALDENSIIRDSTGRIISKIEFYEAVVSGDYQFKPIKDKDGSTIEFLLVKCAKNTSNIKISAISTMPCAPPASLAVGQQAPDFSGHDMTDTVTFDSNFFKGRKIQVLNFWFTKCKPCIDEIPDLNNLMDKYKDRADIVFIAPTFEFHEAIDSFVVANPFNYNILPECYEALKSYKVISYPLNVIVGFDGKIEYISAGGMPGIEFLMDKKIKELLEIPK